ncbi:MAG: hypothetical protein PHX18_02190 [Candidatus Gastranaerophilales bacterium]|nr:hypothetical protein [Candidatus Gastranaerophilales bacterium]
MNSLKLMALMGTYFGIYEGVGKKSVKFALPRESIVSSYKQPHTQPDNILKFDGLNARANYNIGILKAKQPR